MSGQRQKAPVLLADRRAGRGRGLVVAAQAPGKRPPAPPGLRSHARGVWRRFWASPVAAAVDADADHEALRHWIYAVDERERLSELTSAQPLIPGIRHTKDRPHLILNPLFRRLRDLNREIARAEEHFGMTPLARLRLGVTFLQEQAAKEDLAAKRERRRPHRMP